MLLRLAYLTVANTFAALRLLPLTDRDKGAEILVLRHQIAVLERQLAGKRMRFTAADRALLAVSLHRLPLVALLDLPDEPSPPALPAARESAARRSPRCRPPCPQRP